MPNVLQPYDRSSAVTYAHLWAYGRNPAYYDYEGIGGDCTNFASQCLYAGSFIMNFTRTFGWYYINANEKAPAWSGVQYLYNFLTREEASVGPAALETSIEFMEPGDLVQLSFDGSTYTHTPVIVAVKGRPRSLSDILVAAHSIDSDNRPLNTYQIKKIRFLHITGVWRPEP